MVGNCLQLNSGCQLYDRVYVGAGCPVEHENYMKNLIKIGGVLVMPLNDRVSVPNVKGTLSISQYVSEFDIVNLADMKLFADIHYLKHPEYLQHSNMLCMVVLFTFNCSIMFKNDFEQFTLIN